MKNNLFRYSVLSVVALVVVVIMAKSGMCASDVTQHVPAQAPGFSFHKTAIKFLKTMGGVALSSFIIYAGLTLYNKFFVKNGLDGNSEEDVLKTPRSTDEALDFFIKKNKIGY